MKIGDYVGQIINSWTYHNPEVARQLRRELFGDDGPIPVGVVVDIEQNYHPSKGAPDPLDRKILVLGEGGQITKYAASRLEVIKLEDISDNRANDE